MKDNVEKKLSELTEKKIKVEQMYYRIIGAISVLNEILTEKKENRDVSTKV